MRWGHDGEPLKGNGWNRMLGCCSTEQLFKSGAVHSFCQDEDGFPTVRLFEGRGISHIVRFSVHTPLAPCLFIRWTLVRFVGAPMCWRRSGADGDERETVGGASYTIGVIGRTGDGSTSWVSLSFYMVQGHDRCDCDPCRDRCGLQLGE